MALTKQSVPVNFSNGLDTKTDPNQVQVGKFLTLTNSVFTKGGALTKRNGFANITTLPDRLQTTLTTLNDNLVATGSSLYSYNADINQWTDQGLVQPVSLSTLPLSRTSSTQTAPDAYIASNGLVCSVYMANSIAYVQVSDSQTGEQILKTTAITTIDTTISAAAAPRAFVLGNYFIVTYLATVSSTPHIKYIAIPITNPNATFGPTNISSVVRSLSAGYDATVVNNTLYICWASSSSSVLAAQLSTSLVLSGTVTVSNTHSATAISVVADDYNPTAIKIWFVYYDSSTTNGYASVYDQTFGVTYLASATVISSTLVNTITAYASNESATIFYEVENTYASPYPVANVETDYINSVTCTQSGTVGTPTTILRSVGLASKAFFSSVGNSVYMFVAYGDINQSSAANNSNQPTYFLIDSSGNIYMRLAYSNGGGYATTQVLSNVSTLNDDFYIAYSYADFLATVNKGTNNPSGTPSNAVYAQLGTNLAAISINTSGQYSSEIANALHLTGGQLWEYDGVKPVEHGFQVWPENVQAVWSATGGSMAAIPAAGGSNTNAYFYQATYEWTDAVGNLHRSAPSIPFPVTTTGSGTAGSVVLYIPTLRLTYKTGSNPVRIVVYRWSQGQQEYYQITSITSPHINSTTTDFITFTDTFSDAQILGNTLLYTTGGVIENIAAPASVASALFKNRLFLVDAEDRNLLWYSKQVIEAVPVEMSDLFTLYVAPTTGAQGSTGPVTALSAMDDKLIIFKKDAIYYLTGQGPDNTGAGNDFTDPIYITSSVGCSNPNSVVLMPNGLMFQSDKGIWLLGRDLSTQYVGAPVEVYNSQTVENAQAIPGTNQVRFLLNGTTLMYDYYYNQWGTFSNIYAVSSTLYQGYHTYLNIYGQVFQESPGTYLDGTTPVLMSLTTSWMNVAGIRGFERFYYFLMLGTYYTPFKLNVQLAYDFGAPEYNIVVTPDNQTPNWGGDALWGSGQDWGGIGNSFQARIFPQHQKCQTFQIIMNEVYDSSFGQPAGQGLSLSGFNFVIGVKKGYTPQRASRSFG